MIDRNDATSELRRFLLEGLPSLGILAEAPQYGLVDLILPESMAPAVDGKTFLRLALNPEAAASDKSVEYLGYGSPLLDRLLAVAREGTACMRWYVRRLQHPPKDLRAEVARQVTFPNAWISAKQATEGIAYHYAVILWFRATILSHERRERLIPVAIDLHSHRPLSPQTLLLADLDTEGDPFMPVAPFGAPPGGEPATELQTALVQAQEQAAKEAQHALAAELASAAERSSRRMEASHSRLESFYADMARNLEQRIRRTDDDKREGLQAKLAAVTAERERKMREAEEQHRVRLVLHLVAGAIVARPMPTTSVVVENRYGSTTLPVAWDTLGKALDVPVCQICRSPSNVLHLCANGHLVCPADIVRCSACKREYCRQCGIGECAVDHAPLCPHHQTVCPTCGKTVCKEHQGLCHRPAPEPQAGIEPPQQTPRAEARAHPKSPGKSAKLAERKLQRIPPTPTLWEVMRWDIHPGFAERRQQEWSLLHRPTTPDSHRAAISQAQSVPQLERLLDGLYRDAWDVWAKRAAAFGWEALELMQSLVGSTHPANRTMGALVISHLEAQDVPLFLTGMGRLPLDFQATIAVGLGCSKSARSIPEVGDTLLRLASKMCRDIGQINASACWAMMLALQDLNHPRRDDALLMGLTRVGVAHLPHLLVVVGARHAPPLTEALIRFAVKQLGTDLEQRVVQALAVLAQTHDEGILDVLATTPTGERLRQSAQFEKLAMMHDLQRLLALLVPEQW